MGMGNSGWGRSHSAVRPSGAGLQEIIGASLLTANVELCGGINWPRPVCIYLGAPRVRDQTLDGLGGYEGNLRALLTATVETSTVRLVCDWRGYVMLVAQQISIAWSWIRIPVGAEGITFSVQWGVGGGDGSHRPTLFDPITTVGGILTPLGTETFDVPNLAAGVTLAADQINATGEVQFLNGQGITLSAVGVAQGTRALVPAGSRSVVLANTGAATMAENSGLVWDFQV